MRKHATGQSARLIVIESDGYDADQHGAAMLAGILLAAGGSFMLMFGSFSSAPPASAVSHCSALWLSSSCVQWRHVATSRERKSCLNPRKSYRKTFDADPIRPVEEFTDSRPA